ncbi:hypothetical protein ACFQ3W_24345 [Paenibacillus puldeungensis]|uniref:Glycosyltransferase n=1 Tax=Paenibacillus puldeungensis TaxID=696536 RepID=A0ABW3S3N4_9BACL
MKEKRILWLFNNGIISELELPLIRDLGFEIFTPKVVLKEILQANGSVTYEYDKTLTIPEDELRLLNSYNFYSDSNMPLKIKKIINKYFSTALTYPDNSFCTFKTLLRNFEGNIFFRTFGVGLSSTASYSKLIKYNFSNNDLNKLQQIKKRLWFSECYSNLSGIEENIFKDKAVYMPFGIPIESYEIKNQWTGYQSKLLFFCKEINCNLESKEIYNNFTQDFKGFDYVIAGNQPVPIDDERVVGYIEREEIFGLYKECRVMYYHSSDPRYLPYNPIEAMIAGMPVVYLEGGLLNILGGNRQSGCCKDVKEAKKKIKKILEGDADLIEKIQQDQKEILYKFSYEYVFETWRRNFIPILENTPITQNTDKKIAVFLPEKTARFHLSDYNNFMLTLNKAVKSINGKNSVFLNVLSSRYSIENDFSDLISNSISVREYSFEDTPYLNIQDTLELMFEKEPELKIDYLLPVDHAKNFVEADYWLFLDDQLDNVIPPLKPYGIYIENIGDKYYQLISTPRLYNIRNAAFILTLSNQSKKDIVNFYGVSEANVYVVPFVFKEPKLVTDLPIKSEYTLLEIDLNQKDIVRNILKNISDFYRLYRSNLKIKVICNNYEEDSIFLDQINDYLQKDEFIKTKVSLHVNINENEYNALYAFANKVVFTYNIKNIYYKLSRAAYFSKKIVVNDFPFYQEFERQINYEFYYQNFFNSQNQLVEELAKNDSELEIKHNYKKDDEIDVVSKISKVLENFL